MNTSKCRRCGQVIFFAKTEAGKAMPIDAKPEKRIVLVDLSAGPDLPDEKQARVVDTFVSHFATCPAAADFRKPKGKPDGKNA